MIRLEGYSRPVMLMVLRSDGLKLESWKCRMWMKDDDLCL